MGNRGQKEGREFCRASQQASGSAHLKRSPHSEFQHPTLPSGGAGLLERAAFWHQPLQSFVCGFFFLNIIVYIPKQPFQLNE